MAEIHSFIHILYANTGLRLLPFSKCYLAHVSSLLRLSIRLQISVTENDDTWVSIENVSAAIQLYLHMPQSTAKLLTTYLLEIEY